MIGGDEGGAGSVELQPLEPDCAVMKDVIQLKHG